MICIQQLSLNSCFHIYVWCTLFFLPPPSLSGSLFIFCSSHFIDTLLSLFLELFSPLFRFPFILFFVLYFFNMLYFLMFFQLVYPLLFLFKFIIFLFNLHISLLRCFFYSFLYIIFLICIFHLISFFLSHALSFFFSSIFLSCSPPSLLLIFNAILGTLLTLFTFTRSSPSTIFILFGASFFPFSRSSHYLFCSISCFYICTLLSIVSSRTLPEYLLSSFFSVSISPSLPPSSSQFTSVDRDRINRRRQGGR